MNLLLGFSGFIRQTDQTGSPIATGGSDPEWALVAATIVLAIATAALVGITYYYARQRTILC
jgi:hypothetical protein